MSDILNKFFACEIKQVEEETREVVAYITTEDVDRDGQVVLAKGLRLDSYKRNPVVLRGHDRQILVGKNVWIKEDKRGTLACTKFATNDAGIEEWNLYRGGFKNAFSIGFIPDRTKASPPSPAELNARPEWKGAKTVFRSSELFEYSTVLLPCNPNAVAVAYHAKTLAISAATAKQLGIPETPPAASTKVYSFVSESTLKASFEGVDWSGIAEKMNRKLSEQIPDIVKDALHVARGGV